MSAIATPSVKSIILTIDRPYEEDGTTPRDDLIGVKVWHSTVSGFNPLDVDGNQVTAPSYDGPSLNCVLAPLDAGVEYFVRYALISEIDPTFIDLSDQISCTPNSESGGEPGQDALAVILTSDSHSVPASLTGVVSSYTGSGTDVLVYEGVMALAASTSGAPGTFSIGTPTMSPAASITVGERTYSGSAANVAAHSGMSNGVDVVTITFPVIIKTLSGDTVNISKTQTITKAKTGATGDTGAQGPAVVVASNRALSYTATDGALDASQGNTLLTAQVSGITSPTYAWTFSGLQTNPTASTTNAQSITQAQFGTSKSATVTCTVNGTYVSQVTIVRLEKSSAAAGANNTSIDSSGNIHGVSSGDGTGVANGNISISKDGVLSGAGTSEQVNLTYIPGTLIADRIETGTLKATTKISIGDDIAGIEIDAGQETITVKGSKAYQISIFLKGSLTPLASKPAYIDDTAAWAAMTTEGWTDFLSPAQIVANQFWVATGTVSRAGMISWENTGVNNLSVKLWDNYASANAQTPAKGEYAAFALNTSPTVNPTSSYAPGPVAPGTGQYQWMRWLRINPFGTATVWRDMMVSNENDKRVSYTPVVIGKLKDGADHGYGIMGRNSNNNVIFRLDDEGLYLKPNLNSSLALGISPAWTGVLDGMSSQQFEGATPAATGSTTTYVKIGEISDIGYEVGISYTIRALNEFARVTNSNGLTTIQYNSIKNSDYFCRTYKVGATTTYPVTEAIATSFTSTTSLPVNRSSVIIDETGSVTGKTPGIYLKLVSHSMYSYDNPTYNDRTLWRFTVWKHYVNPNTTSAY